MANVVVTSSGQINVGARVVVRSSTGIVYVFVNDGGNIQAFKGNAQPPTSFTEQNAAGAPNNSDNVGVAAAIDANDLVHVAYYFQDSAAMQADPEVQYATFRTADHATTQDDWASIDATVANLDASGGFGFVDKLAIAVDANNDAHIAWNDDTSNMGQDRETIYYDNNIGGTFGGRVLVSQKTTTGTNNLLDLIIGDPQASVGADRPILITEGEGDETSINAYQGGALNSTGFSLEALDVTGSIVTIGDASLAIDSNKRIIIAFIESSTFDLMIVEHRHFALWASSNWETPSDVDTSRDYVEPSIAINGTEIYIFAESPTDSDIRLLKNTDPEDTYFFDGSDTPAEDVDAAWSNETNADDGDPDTDATTNTAGSNGSNDLFIGGTNAPASGGTIQRVRARAWGDGGGSGDVINIDIHTDGQGESLGQLALPINEGWSPRITLSVPSGGWTFAKLQALESTAFKVGTTTTGSLSRVEIIVETGSGWVEVTAGDLPEVGTFSDVKAKWANKNNFEGAVQLDYVFEDDTGGEVRWNEFKFVTVVTETHTTDSLLSHPNHRIQVDIFRNNAGHNILPNGDNWYAVVSDKDALSIHMYKSTNNGLTWSLIDDADRPQGTNYVGPAMAVDSAGLFHISWIRNATNGGMRHTTFNPSTDQWNATVTSHNTDNVALSDDNDVSNDIAIDANDDVHVMWKEANGANFPVKYSNNISGSFKAKINVTAVTEDTTNICMIMDDQDRPVMFHMISGFRSVENGNATDATSFGTDFAGGSENLTANSGLVIAADDDEYIIHINDTNDLVYRRRAAGGGTFGTSIDIQTGTFAHAGAAAVGNVIYAFGQETSGNIRVFYSTDDGTTWSEFVADLIDHGYPAFFPTSFNARHNLDSPTGIAITFQTDGTDLYSGFIDKPTLTHTTDSVLKALDQTLTHDTDSVLKALDTEITHTTDSFLAVGVTVVTVTHDTDSFLLAVRTEDHTTDSVLRAIDTEITHTTDSILKALDQEITHTTDSFLLAVRTEDHTTDSILRAIDQELTHTTDSVLREIDNEITHTTDSFLLAVRTLTHTTDSVLKALDQEVTHTTDSTLKALDQEISHTTDSVLVFVQTLTHTTDSVLKALDQEITHTTDSFLLAIQTEEHTTDSVLKLLDNEITHTTDSVLGERDPGIPVTHTTDSVLKALDQEITHTTDSVLRAIDNELTHTTDSFLLAVRTLTHTTDSVLKALDQTEEHTTDSVLKLLDIEITHTTDSVLGERDPGFTVEHTTDSVLRAIDTEITHTTDSFLALGATIVTETHTTDSVLKALDQTETHDTDSVLRKLDNEITHTTDSVLGEREPGFTITHTTDSVLKELDNLLTHTTDSVLKALDNEINHTTDSFLAVGAVIITVTHTTDSLIVIGVELTHTTDSILRKLDNEITHTTDSIVRFPPIRSIEVELCR